MRPGPGRQEALPFPVISVKQLAEALEALDPRDREVLDLSLRRRVPDEALAELWDCTPGDVARRRAAAVENIAERLGVQRGEDLGAVLKALLEPQTWAAMARGEQESRGGVAWRAFADPAAASSSPPDPEEHEPPREKDAPVTMLPDREAEQAPPPQPPAAASAEPSTGAELASAEEAGQAGTTTVEAAPRSEPSEQEAEPKAGNGHMAGSSEPAFPPRAPGVVPPPGEHVLEMLGALGAAEDRRRRRFPVGWFLAGGIGSAALFAAGFVGATQFGDRGEEKSSGGGEGPRHFVPESSGPVAKAPFPSDPQKESCYTTATVSRPTVLHRKPGGRPLKRIRARTEWGSPRILGVVRRRGDWLAVLAPELKNGAVGWVKRDLTRVECVRWSVHVDLSKRRVLVRKDGHTVGRLKVAIGSRRHPTPKGRFAVTDKLKVTDKGSPYGCCVLALTGHQTRLPPDWPGGDRLAIHATTDTGSIGKPVSLGCMRSTPRRVRWLIDTVPLGAPIFIRA